MKKNYWLILFLVFVVFSCKGTPKNNKSADEPGLSQLELTKEDDQVEENKGFSDETSEDETSVDEASSDDDTLVQDGITDGSEIIENLETKTDDFQTEEKAGEKPLVVKTVEEIKEAPKSEDKKPSVEDKRPSVPAERPVQPPPVMTKEELPPAPDVPPEQPAQEKQDAAQSESADEKQEAVPPRSQPWIAPPPAVTAVKDDAPVPNRQVLIPPKEEIVFSRIVRATVGQLVEIPFRGTGWVYMGELTSRRGLAFNSRRLDIEGQNFVFTAEEAGTYALKFFKHDYIRDYILNDYVQVIVGESPDKSGVAGWFNPPADRGRVTAEPRWPSAFDEEAILRGGPRPAPVQTQGTTAPSSTAASSKDSTPAQPQGALPPSSTASANRESASAQAQSSNAPPLVTSPPAVVTPQTNAPPAASQTQPTAAPTAITPDADKQEILPPEEILKKAQENFTAGNTASAIALLDQYKEHYTNGSDELYWLYGQFYEANTTSRNILLSLDYYRRLVNEYPQSMRYNDARRRISYLERFYINIQ